MSLSPLYVLLGGVSVQVFCPFFNWVVCLPGVESCEFFIYFGDQTLVIGIIGKYVFPYSWFSFHFNAVFFSHAEAFHFDEVPLVYSFLYVPCSRYISVKILLHGISEIFLPMISFFRNQRHFYMPTRKYQKEIKGKIPFDIATRKLKYLG